MILWDMKRFFTPFLFPISLLCYGVSAGQIQADIREEPDASPPASEQQGSADGSPNSDQKQLRAENADDIENGLPWLLERVPKLAGQANTAFMFSLLATIFGGLSWMTAAKSAKASKKIGEDTLAIIRNATKAEFQPYLEPVEGFKISQIESGIGPKINQSTLYSYEFKMTNIGKTPASLVETSVRAKFYKNGRHFDETGSIESNQIGDLIPNKTWDYQIRLEFDFPNGDGRNFSHPKEIDIFITASFQDNFGKGGRRTYVFHYLCDAIPTGAKLQSIEEKKYA